MTFFKEHGFVGSDDNVQYSAKATCIEMEAQEMQGLEATGWTKVGGSMLLHVAENKTREKAQELCAVRGSKLVEFWSEHEWNEVSWCS